MTPPSKDPAVKKSISFPKSLYEAAMRRAESLGYNLSEYLQHLARNDKQLGGRALPRIAEDPQSSQGGPHRSLYYESAEAPDSAGKRSKDKPAAAKRNLRKAKKRASPGLS